jgi:flagellar motor component MotA
MILWNSELVKRLSCTDEEKSSLPKLIRSLVALAARARIEGVKALQTSGTELQGDSLLVFGFRLIAEGLPVETLEEILAVHLAVDPETGYEFLTRCLCAETLVSIAAGDAPEITLRKLAPYCGAESALTLLSSTELPGSTIGL